MRTREGRRGLLFICILAVVLLALLLLSFGLGRYAVPPAEVIRILLSRIFPVTPSWTEQMETAVISIRLPRILLACMVGGCLSAAGTAYQSVFRNPMAAPDILGASSGACFGAALAILLGFSRSGVTALAFVSSLLSVALVYAIARRAKGNPVTMLLLAGVTVGSYFFAAMALPPSWFAVRSANFLLGGGDQAVCALVNYRLATDSCRTQFEGKAGKVVVRARPGTSQGRQ